FSDIPSLGEQSELQRVLNCHRNDAHFPPASCEPLSAPSDTHTHTHTHPHTHHTPPQPPHQHHTQPHRHSTHTPPTPTHTTRTHTHTHTHPSQKTLAEHVSQQLQHL